jgi:hypothetical protein
MDGFVFQCHCLVGVDFTSCCIIDRIFWFDPAKFFPFNGFGYHFSENFAVLEML